MTSSEAQTNPQVDSTYWMQWCRLCAGESDEHNINVFEKYEQQKNCTDINMVPSWNLPNAIKHYFFVNITKDDPLPQSVCSECFTFISNILIFSERTAKVQKLYNDLQCINIENSVNLKDVLIRAKFDLDKRLLDNTLQQQGIAEIYYVDEKHKLSDSEVQLPDSSELDNPLESIKSEYVNEFINEGDQKYDPIKTNTDDENDLTIELELVNKKRGRKISKIQQDQSSIRNSIAKPYECTECLRKFGRIGHLHQHLKFTHKQQIKTSPVQCADCKQEFKAPYLLKQHQLKHLPENERNTLPCPLCDKKFSNNWSVKQHVHNIHKDERPFVCEECGFAVRTSGTLKTHMLTHTDYAPHECDVCKKCFKSERRLRIHKEIHDPNKHICAECGHELNSRVTLKRHLLVHSDEMRYKCDYCGKAFKRPKALKNHLILHTGLKPYVCEFCDRTFACGSNYASHKKKSHPVELAQQKASGITKTYTHNIPKLETLKAITRNKDGLTPVASKESGCFAFGKKRKS